MSKMMKVLLSLLAVEVVMGGAFLTWIFFGVNLKNPEVKVGRPQGTTEVADLGEAELKGVESDLGLDTADNIDIAEFDKLIKDIDKINLSGI